MTTTEAQTMPSELAAKIERAFITAVTSGLSIDAAAVAVARNVAADLKASGSTAQTCDAVRGLVLKHLAYAVADLALQVAA